MSMQRFVGLFLRALCDILVVRVPAPAFTECEDESLGALLGGLKPGYVVLSVKFDRGYTINRDAQFVQSLLGSDVCYCPNWFRKSDCGRDCRGIGNLCGRATTDEMGRPTAESCWKFSYRWHLAVARALPTIMLRLVTRGTYGAGQLEESRMARDLGISVVELHLPFDFFHEIWMYWGFSIVGFGLTVVSLCFHNGPLSGFYSLQVAYTTTSVAIANSLFPGSKAALALALGLSSAPDFKLSRLQQMSVLVAAYTSIVSMMHHRMTHLSDLLVHSGFSVVINTFKLDWLFTLLSAGSWIIYFLLKRHDRMYGIHHLYDQSASTWWQMTKLLFLILQLYWLSASLYHSCSSRSRMQGRGSTAPLLLRTRL